MRLLYLSFGATVCAGFVLLGVTFSAVHATRSVICDKPGNVATSQHSLKGAH